MRALAAWLFGVHVLLGAVAPGGMAEVMRLPCLAKHYQAHVAVSGGDLTVAEFLVMHYADPEHGRQDRSHHDALPFHGPSPAMQFIAPVPPPAVLATDVGPAPPESPAGTADVGGWIGRSVFQPPKGRA